MKKLTCLLAISLTGFIVACSRPKIELRNSGTLSEPALFKVRNLTVIHIDPNGKEVSVDWKGYNLLSGSAFNIPFEVIEISSGDEKYLISDEEAGNNELLINGTLRKFDSTNHQLLIKFGEGISIENGGNYQNANDPYNFTFSP